MDAGLLYVWYGALEHPEELTDRCCLSALAGLSKYLPSLSAREYYRCDVVLCQVLVHGSHMSGSAVVEYTLPL